MQFEPLPIPGAFTIRLSPFQDERGVFSRLFCADELSGIDHTKEIVQVNHSVTKEAGSIRGMHFQHPPYAEIKIIRCLRGKAYDVMVDLRAGSPTFLKWHAVELSFDAFNMVYIPEGCAHGFQVLEENCELLYFHTSFYNKATEGGVRYNDDRIGIEWPLPPKNLSQKDLNYPLLDDSFRGIQITTTNPTTI
jgi:dTDP-4-dehydrorhamnose 3,5-epimerase